MSALTFLIFILCSASLVFANDFKTIDGKEYKNVKVSRVEPDGLVLTSKSGISKVYFAELPKEVQDRFHYDAAKGDAYSAEQTANQEALYKQRQEAERQRVEERARYWGEHAAPPPQSSSSSSASPNRQDGQSGGAIPNQPAPSAILSRVRVGPGSVPMLTLQQFEADQFSMTGRIVGIQFNFRDAYTRRIDGNWFSGDIRRYDPLTTTHRQFERAEVLIPANALSWFQAIPNDSSSAREIVAYAQVEENRSGGTVLHLLGTQIHRDMNGNGEITW